MEINKIFATLFAGVAGLIIAQGGFDQVSIGIAFFSALMAIVMAMPNNKGGTT